MFSSIIEEEYDYQESGSHWYDSTFEKIDKLKNDHSGKCGEKLIRDLCKENNIAHVYEEDIIDSEGHYDIIINNKRVEIKTARLGKQGAFQHENLKNDGNDYYMFVDVVPNGFYITVMDSQKTNLTERHEIIGRKPHLRDATTGVYKFDFSAKNLQKGIQAGITMKVDDATPVDCIGDFIKRTIL
jgi:hypothetical protein